MRAAGNARGGNYDVNADGVANNTNQIVVAGADRDGDVTATSSYGSAILVSGFGEPGGISTIDRTGTDGTTANDFNAAFGGTEAAAAMVSGVVALMLESNPDLGWRDVQSILAASARHVGSEVGAGPSINEQTGSSWNAATSRNGGGMHFSNDYGYGLVDARAAVRMGETWLVGRSAQTSAIQFTQTRDYVDSNVVIFDGDIAGYTITQGFTSDDQVERVEVSMIFSTTFLGDLELYVTSPDGTRSLLVRDNASGADFNGTWTFESQAFQGERAAGNWHFTIVDDQAGDALVVSDLKLSIHGAAGLDDRYVYTNEYFNFVETGGHLRSVADTNGGINDIVDASAVLYSSLIDLNELASSHIGGESFMIASGTIIEHAIGGDGDDTLRGNIANNQLHGNRGADTLEGGAGFDTLIGGSGDDLLMGGADGDLLDGGIGSDGASYAGSNAGVTVRLWNGTGTGGHAQGDTLTSIERVVGSSFNDSLVGSASQNDILIGGAGNDYLQGLGGADRFAFSGASGSDTIGDFEVAGGDVINLNGSVFTDFADVMAHTTDTGGGAQISKAGVIITLTGVTKAQLTSGHFEFAPAAAPAAFETKGETALVVPGLTGDEALVLPGETVAKAEVVHVLPGLDEMDPLVLPGTFEVKTAGITDLVIGGGAGAGGAGGGAVLDGLAFDLSDLSAARGHEWMM